MKEIVKLIFSVICCQNFWREILPLRVCNVHVNVLWQVWTRSRSWDTLASVMRPGRDEVMQPHDPEKHITLFHVIKYHDLKLKLIKLSISSSSAPTWACIHSSRHLDSSAPLNNRTMDTELNLSNHKWVLVIIRRRRMGPTRSSDTYLSLMS